MGFDPEAAIIGSHEAGFMEHLVPEFCHLAMDEDGKGRHKDNLWHTAKVVAKCPPVLRVRVAAFFHDIGKPPTRKFEDGKVTFYNHEAVGARMTRKIMKRLGYDEEFANEVALIVEMSGRVRGAETWSDSAVRRFASDAGPVLDDLLTFCYNDVTSRHAKNVQKVQDQVNILRGRIDAVRRLDEERARRPPINGHQVMERFNLESGPQLGLLMALITPEMSEEEAWAKLGAAVLSHNLI